MVTQQQAALKVRSCDLPVEEIGQLLAWVAEVTDDGIPELDSDDSPEIIAAFFHEKRRLRSGEAPQAVVPAVVTTAVTATPVVAAKPVVAKAAVVKVEMASAATRKPAAKKGALGIRAQKALQKLKAQKALKKQKKADKDPNAPKRATGAYLYYSIQQRTATRTAMGGGTPHQVSAALGEAWKALPEEDKEPYQELAAKDKARHAAEVAAYVPRV